jgi:hypothetical protein
MATSAIVPLNDVRARTSSNARPTAELPSNAQSVVINDSIAPPTIFMSKMYAISQRLTCLTRVIVL